MAKYELTKLVTKHEISEMLGVSPGAVTNWGKRENDFPNSIYAWGAVEVFDIDQIIAWHRGRYPKSLLWTRYDDESKG